VTENEYLIAVSNFTYFGPARLKLLYSYFKSSKKIWQSSISKLNQLGISEKKTNEFIEFRKSFDIKNYFGKLSKLGIKTTTYLDKDFPKSLINLDDSPAVLYYKGSLSGLKSKCIAIVGARKMTSYGHEVAEKFAGSLGNFGVTVVSGLARGIDTAAHKACLAANGVTVAVLGNGLDTVYPPENKNLADEIIANNGAIISEFPLGYPAIPVNFAIRNRIVSGISDAVIIVEGAEKSGTLLTASHAADQGKTVFAVPGQITSPLSAAPLFLLKNGAKIATEIKDVLDELDLEIKVDAKKMESLMPEGPVEKIILKILENEALYLDELVRISGKKTSDISARLTIMEMKGLVKNLGGGKYRKV
jgi:DNA processing protein